MVHRYNKDKTIDSTGVTCIRWLPFDSNIFVVAHESGRMYTYNLKLPDEHAFSKDLHEAFNVQPQGKATCNPTQKWAVSNKPLNDVVFSPSNQYCAIPSRDSYCHVVHWEERKLRLKIRSYFGAILCVAWSPDERYIVTGGEDDTVSIYDFRNECVTARCSGHHSWVTAVAFDVCWSDKSAGVNEECALMPTLTDTAPVERYRLVSVSQDSRLLLWDFESLPMDEESLGAVPQHSLDPKGHPSTPDACPVIATNDRGTPVIDPICMQRVHQEPICGLAVYAGGMFTVCAGAVVKVWQLAGNGNAA
uniref:Guanine nucleotide-binding protein subunit beta-like protein n=1 Tax=Eutreptiella gymnastica TaxID=73025 RepID=A0A7S1HTV7_9EUGL|mmetsp:Transcript_105300/g.181616  ORF Transcript_105300/g.181616 Transcript_105300/m.181616 type:complete len:305 (+) Transcript_105300:579-1493(+)